MAFRCRVKQVVHHAIILTRNVNHNTLEVPLSRRLHDPEPPVSVGQVP